MAIFRVEKNTSYTVMSNHHLRNQRLSLKAKGLLSQMLSLPEDWDYTLQGLAHINQEGIDAIRAAVKELEKEGYITRSRVRKNNGQLGGAEYVIHEEPTSDASIQDQPTLENPTQVMPVQGNAMQLNKEETNKESQSKEKSNQIKENYLVYEKIVKDNISYGALKYDLGSDNSILDEIVGLVVETLCSKKKSIRIAGNWLPANLVKSQFLKLNMGHIRYVLECLAKNTSEIHNIKQYLLTVLFNAPNTMSNYYAARVNHDFGAT